VINFFVVVPTLNPVFVTLLPYPITLLSKILFGWAMVSVMQVSPGAPREISTARAERILIGICRAAYFSRSMDADYPVKPPAIR